jgi:hypothetical protein
MQSPSPRVFVVAGMPRTATTFLYQRFQEHPSIFCPYRKETMYFSVNYERGPAWFRSLYDGMAPGQIGADVSPAYFLDERVIDRILRVDPVPRVILGVRTASEWALSWYTHVLTHHWRHPPSLEAFLTGYRYEITAGEIWQDLRGGFVRRMIEGYREAFGNGLLIYHHRALKSDPLSVVNAIERFVGVPEHFSEENFRNQVVNAGTRRNVSLATYLLSREQFVASVGRLLPRRLVQAGRNAFVALGAGKRRVEPPSFTADEVALATAIFSEDDAWIASQFEDAPLQLGSGSPIEVEARSAGA